MGDYDYDDVSPDASSLIESLRSIGYTLETAIADIVDNSITANSEKIFIDFFWSENNSYIRILDNGHGMTEEELIAAMKIGSQNPLNKRPSKDLGRFGMGLKTASFSLAKRLTVYTNNGITNSIRCWDLDFVCKEDKWALLKDPYDKKSQDNLGVQKKLGKGTIVLLENLDRLLPYKYNSKNYDNYLNKISSVEKHLSMVFHRFFSGKNSIEIYINNRKIKAWDPFLINEETTQELIEEPFIDGAQIINVKSYILPHHSKITKEVYDYAEGPKGWNSQQGFYIYRNKRLLVAGSWLGLFKKEEPYKLARIAVDISSESDYSWQIDVKKSTAKPPSHILNELERIASLTRKSSYRVFYHRGIKINSKKHNSKEKTAFVWEQIYKRGSTFYKLNRSHPFLQELMEDTSVDERLLNAYLVLIEENAPANLINNATTVRNETKEDNEDTLDDNEKENILNIVRDFAYSWGKLGYSNEEILARLLEMEPFKSKKSLVIKELNEK